EYSLDELGQNLFPSISKSAVKYRWRKLQKIMEDNL
ncbi:MAG: DNA-binding protein WhiA, partial [Synergistaceae bacterium]|nr:DNA-binding protein WhiA [Synergistaceae bacterium]